MKARAFGSATISFGLVSIPVKIFTTKNPEAQLSFRLVHDTCGTPLRQQFVCPKHNQVVDRDHIAKAYEHEDNQYVQMAGDELAQLKQPTDPAIDLCHFVAVDAVDPLYFDKAYYLAPAPGAERAYRLLSRALELSGHGGMARQASRGKQYVVFVRAFEGGLILHQLRYREGVRSFADVPKGADVALSDAEIELAMQLVARASRPAPDLDSFRDPVKARARDLIDGKLARAELEEHDAGHRHEHDERGDIIELLAALRASLGPSSSASSGSPAGASRGVEPLVRKPPRRQMRAKNAPVSAPIELNAPLQ